MRKPELPNMEASLLGLCTYGPGRPTVASLLREARQEEQTAMHHAREAQRLRREAEKLKRQRRRR